MTEEPLVLVIEDDRQVRRFLRTTLPPQGYRVVEASTGEDGLALAVRDIPDVVLLDLGLPDLDGIEVLGRLRAWSAVPVVVISAREFEHQKVEALDGGADDYLTKPFGFGELVARLRVALRRSRLVGAEEQRFRAGTLEVDLAARRVQVAEADVHLTPIEYTLLTVLVRNAGRVVTHHKLVTTVWGPESEEEPRYLRVHMMHLRRKLGAGLFTTEPGVGYRLVEDRR